MITARFEGLVEAWVEGDDSARWRSTQGHAGAASGSSLLEVPAGCRLPRHTDSAEEKIVVVGGEAEVDGGGERWPLPGGGARSGLPAGGARLVPREVPHEVRNAGAAPLRFVALYAADRVITTYDAEVQPDGGHERQAVGP